MKVNYSFSTEIIHTLNFTPSIGRMKVLALSSSRVGNGGYLENACPLIEAFLGNKSLRVAFIPFASVQTSYEEYGNMVGQALNGLPYAITVATRADASKVVEKADAIMVGGGNTFKLLHDIYNLELFNIIESKVKGGIPYVGWSAGANLCGKTICTTNDMPIIQPRSFKAFGFFPFQVNPHYLNQKLEGHNGETRDQRLEEFLALNPGTPIIGIPEGTALTLNDNELQFIGEKEGAYFSVDQEQRVTKSVVKPGESLSHLL